MTDPDTLHYVYLLPLFYVVELSSRSYPDCVSFSAYLAALGVRVRLSSHSQPPLFARGHPGQSGYTVCGGALRKRPGDTSTIRYCIITLQ